MNASEGRGGEGRGGLCSNSLSLASSALQGADLPEPSKSAVEATVGALSSEAPFSGPACEKVGANKNESWVLTRGAV